MNISVVYATMTGHSKKIAMQIAKSLNIQAINAKENPKLQNVELLLIVGGIYGGQSNGDLTAFTDKLDGANVKNAMIITSSMSEKTRQEGLTKALQDRGINVIDEISCKGSFLFFFGFSHPNKSDLEQIIEKVNAIIEKQVRKKTNE